jgi:AraC-like DNA-binding protein
LTVGRFASGGPSRLLVESVREIERCPGTALRNVAAASGVTLRTLQRRFRDDVGVGPKQYQRIVRFRRAMRLLQQGGFRGAARAATLAGYYDQAHFIRDFRRFAGTTPSRFHREGADLAVTFLGDPASG